MGMPISRRRVRFMIIALACVLCPRISQAQPPFPVCFVALPPGPYTVGPPGGTVLLPVLVEPPFCGGWTATSLDSWLTITSGASGSFQGTIVVNVASALGATRIGTIRVVGRNNTRDI